MTAEFHMVTFKRMSTFHGVEGETVFINVAKLVMDGDGFVDVHTYATPGLAEHNPQFRDTMAIASLNINTIYEYQSVRQGGYIETGRDDDA